MVCNKLVKYEPNWTVGSNSEVVITLTSVTFPILGNSQNWAEQEVVIAAESPQRAHLVIRGATVTYPLNGLAYKSKPGFS